MVARSSLLRRPTPGARSARRTSSVVAALAALAPRLVRLAHHDYPDRLLELVGESQLGLGAAVVEAAEAPGLEDGRAATLRRDEVALRDVDDEVVAHHVGDGPERLHAPLVHPVDRHARDRDDAAAAVEGEGREGEEALPVADLVAEGRRVGRVAEARSGGQVEAADQARADLLLRGARQIGDDLRVAARVVHQVVPEELPGDEDRALLVDGLDPGRAIEGDHALPHVLSPYARERGTVDRGLLRHVEEREAEVVDRLVAEHGLRESIVR